MCTAIVFLLGLFGPGLALSEGSTPYVADPDQDRPTLHVQPPALKPADAGPPTSTFATINGIYYIDVLAAAGYDVAGEDRGNEPAITANPLDPDQIVLTSFSGSDWGGGGNSSIFYSGDGGVTWSYSLSVPPPPGAPLTGCPCDQTMDWGRDGVLFGTFLHVASDFVVYSAQATVPTDPSSWVYRTESGAAQKTSLPAFIYSDQPWLMSGPLPGDNSRTNVCVVYDNFDFAFGFSEMRAADSPGYSPLDFTRDAPTNVDGQTQNASMNPGNRLAIGPDGKIWNVFQRLVSLQSGGVKELTYLVTVSTDGGQTWSVANSDHASGAKIVAANVYSFQGNGSKIGGVNALLGGVDAITVDPSTGNAWIVYGTRSTVTAGDRLYLVSVTYDAGNLIVGTPRLISPTTMHSYLPAVAVLPSGEVGVLFLSLSATLTNFSWRFVQTTDGGLTLAKNTNLSTSSFSSPFASNPAQSNQRIFGDYIQLRAVGCNFYGTYPARGSGTMSVNSIDPYFMNAPAVGPCSLPALTGINPSEVCAGSPGFDLTLDGTGFSNGANGRIQGALRRTTFQGPAQVTASIQASDIATPGVLNVDLLGAAPAGGLTTSLPLAIESPAASPGSSLRLSKGPGTVLLDWALSAGATSYNVRRCASPGSCTIPVVAANTYQEAIDLPGTLTTYVAESLNSCGAVP